MADVEFTLENSVLWITLNRPAAMNAMTAAMRDEIGALAPDAVLIGHVPIRGYLDPMAVWRIG